MNKINPSGVLNSARVIILGITIIYNKLKKTTVILGFLLFSFELLACECVCSKGNIIGDYIKYETIFRAKVIEVDNYNGKANPYPHKVLVDIKQIFKGDPNKSLVIKRGHECWTPNTVLNSEWVFFVSKNSDGILEVHPCNPSVKYKFNPNFIDQIEIVKRRVNNKWKAPKLVAHNKKRLIKSLKSLNPKDLKNNFGFYLIKFNSDKTIKKITIYKSLGIEADKIIKEFYKSMEYWNYQDQKKRILNFKKNTVTSIIINKSELIE